MKDTFCLWTAARSASTFLPLRWRGLVTEEAELTHRRRANVSHAHACKRIRIPYAVNAHPVVCAVSSWKSGSRVLCRRARAPVGITARTNACGATGDSARVGVLDLSTTPVVIGRRGIFAVPGWLVFENARPPPQRAIAVVSRRVNEVPQSSPEAC